MKKVIVLLLLLVFCGSVGQGLYKLKKGFSCRRLQPIDLVADGNFSDEVNRALEQTFTYVGRGRQCFAFASVDGHYILKFPRTDIYKTPLWARALPVAKYRNALEAEHTKREKFVFNSFHLSAQELKGETGVIALHLGQSASSGKILTLIDALGCTHRLPLEKVSFILQHKHPIWTQAFLRSLEQGDRPHAKTILDAFLDVVVDRARKGILNKDRSFLRNYGFDGAKAYQIDVGSFYRKPELSPEAIYQKSVRDSLDPVQEWLAVKDPEMKQYLDQQLQKFLDLPR